MPEIILLKEFYDEEAEKLEKCFTPGVIELEEKNGRKRAIVKNSRIDMCSRQVYMYEEFKESVKLHKIRDHFICKYYRLNYA
jgi:DNA-directed RNA polymerases I and III subunit RPAC1